MATHFEDLCNELLLCIFEYINPRCLYKTFWNLNVRLNKLVESVQNLQFIIDEQEDEELLASLAPRIGLLQVNTWDETDLRGFSNLYSLSLVRPSPIQLKQIRADTMPKLIYLSLFTNVQFSSPKQLISDTFSNRFSHLRWVRLGHINISDLINCSKSYSPRYLHISCCHTTLIPFILTLCPKLECLHVDILQSGEPILDSSTIIDNHPLRQFILRDYSRSISYKDIITLMTYLSNIRKLEFKFECNAPFISFIRYILDSLWHLRKFDCDITEYPIDSSTELLTIQQIHPCFSSIRCRTHTTNFRIFSTL